MTDRERTPEDDHGGPFCDCGECEACYRGQLANLRARLDVAEGALWEVVRLATVPPVPVGTPAHLMPDYPRILAFVVRAARRQ